VLFATLGSRIREDTFWVPIYALRGKIRIARGACWRECSVMVMLTTGLVSALAGLPGVLAGPDLFP